MASINTDWWYQAVLLIILTGLNVYTHGAPAPYADTVILNAKVIIADSDDSSTVAVADAIAIAIRGDRILAVE